MVITVALHIPKGKKGKKDGELTEDDVKNAEKKVQDLTDNYIKEVDAVTAKKESEIMKI